MKECYRAKTSQCASEVNPQPLSNFAKDKKRADQLTVYCKACLKVYRDENKEQRNKTIMEWRKRNPEKMRKYRQNSSEQDRERARKWHYLYSLEKRYGMTKDDWKKMFDAQKGLCLVCKRHADEFKRGLCIDHCHESGKVRGMLCHPCNQGIGLFGENIERLELAIKYLMAHKT